MPRTGGPAPARTARRGLARRGTRSPGVRLGRRATWPGEDLVEAGQRLVVQVDLEGTQRAVQLLDRARPDDRGGDDRLVQQPGDPDVCGVLAELVAIGLVDLQT